VNRLRKVINHFTERGEMKAVLVLIGVLVFASAGTADEYFKWIDERGVVHITNIPSSVPEEYKGQAERRVMPAEEEASSERPREARRPVEEERDRYGRGRDYWVSRTNEAKRRLSRAQGEYERLRGEYRDLRDRYNDTTSLAERDEYKKRMESVQVELRRQSEEVFRARELLERTRAEAASAGAPAEWVQ
jgi:hypothetical protein